MKRLKEQRLLDPQRNVTYHIVLGKRLQRERAGIMHEKSDWQVQTEQKTAVQECILVGVATPVTTILKTVINSKEINTNLLKISGK